MDPSSIEFGRLIQKVDDLTTSVQALEKKVDDLSALKHRGAGVLIAVGVGASAVSSAIALLFKG